MCERLSKLPREVGSARMPEVARLIRYWSRGKKPQPTHPPTLASLMAAAAAVNQR